MRLLLLPLPPLLLAALLAAAPSSAQDAQVEMLRIADQGSLNVSVVRASRGAGPSAPVVVVVQSPGGERLFLRRSQPESGTTVHETWLGKGSAVVMTRKAGQPVLLESGGLSMRFHEGDLARPTVRCWMTALVSKTEPMLLPAAAAIRLLQDWSGVGAAADVFFPVSVIWQVSYPFEARPRGAAEVQKGPFGGASWAALGRAAVEALGRR